VAVTEIAVVEAIADGTIDVAGAIESGLMRLYGPPESVAKVSSWLTGRML
jgi:hypothetical protein